MDEIEGRCPRCFKVMQNCGRNLICDGKRYNFPFGFYYCERHGIYVWRGRKHELFDLRSRMNQKVSIEPLEPEVLERFTKSGRMPTLSDYSVVKMKCPYCGYEWEQYNKTLTTQSGGIICPSCGAEIPREKALVKR